MSRVVEVERHLSLDACLEREFAASSEVKALANGPVMLFMLLLLWSMHCTYNDTEMRTRTRKRANDKGALLSNSLSLTYCFIFHSLRGVLIFCPVFLGVAALEMAYTREGEE